MSTHALELIGVRDPGVDDEYVLLKANEDLDLGSYLVLDTTYDTDGVVSNINRHVYGFKSMTVKKGDYIALFSKVGKYHVGKTSSAKPLHYIYWGLRETIWNKDGDCAWLIYAPQSLRQSKVIPPAK